MRSLGWWAVPLAACASTPLAALPASPAPAPHASSVAVVSSSSATVDAAPSTEPSPSIATARSIDTPPSLPEAPGFQGPSGSMKAGCATCTVTRTYSESAKGPFLAVELVAEPVDSTFGYAKTNTEFYLAVRTKAGWYLKDVGMRGLVCGGDKAYLVDFTEPKVVRVDDALYFQGLRCTFSGGSPACVYAPAPSTP